MHVIFLAAHTRIKVDWTRPLPPVTLIATPALRGKLRHGEEAEFAGVHTVETMDLESLLALLESFGLDLTTCRFVTLDEDLVDVAATLRTAFSAPGPSVVDVSVFTDKRAMKKALGGTVRLPRWTSLDFAEIAAATADGSDVGVRGYHQLSASLGPQFVVKPTVGAGSTGVVFINDAADWVEWCGSRPQGEFEADEFIRTPLFHVDTVLDGDVARVFVSEYMSPNAEFLRGRHVGSIPLDPSDARFEPLHDLNDRVLSQLDAHPGVYHLEAFLGSDLQPVFLEVAARPSGGMVTECYQHTHGINLHNATLTTDPTEGGWLLHGSTPAPRRAHGCWMWVSPRPGLLAKQHSPALRGQAHAYWRCSVGDRLDYAGNVVDRAGGLLVHNESAQDATADFEYLRDQYEPIEMESL